MSPADRSGLRRGTALLSLFCWIACLMLPACSGGEPKVDRTDQSIMRMLKLTFLISLDRSRAHEFSGKRLVLYSLIASARHGVTMKPDELFSPFHKEKIPGVDDFRYSEESLRHLDPGPLTSFAGRIQGARRTKSSEIGDGQPILADALHPDGVLVVFDDFTAQFIPRSELAGGVARFGRSASHPLLEALSDE